MIVDMSNWGFPQWAIICLYFLGIWRAAIVHGKPQTGEHNFHATMIAVILVMTLLAYGGFFK